MLKRLLLVVAVFVVSWAPSAAQKPIFTDVFPPEEFAGRRARVMEQIGDGVAILLGAAEPPGELRFRQGNQFFYLTGVEEPRAIVLLDGRTKKTTLYLQAQNRERAYGGPLLKPGEEAAQVTGIDTVVVRDELANAVSQIARERRTIYTPFRQEVFGSASAGDVTAYAANTVRDPWDGRLSREANFIAKLQSLAPQCEVRNLDPILDQMRFFKSPREIEVIREATRIAGEAMLAAMREAAPGKYEYELEAAATYVFRKNGAQGAAYFALFATGRNTVYSHYHRGTTKLQDGDWVQVDWAPDYKYYVSDITRVFPANGRFTPWQREYYSIYLQLYKAIIASMKVNVAPRESLKEAVKTMDAAIAAFNFTDPRIKAAAQRFADRFRNGRSNSFGHMIGMEVHDVGRQPETLQPGHVFTIEPAMSIPEDGISMRLEDVFLVTERGVEILSSFVPIEIDDVERAMVTPVGRTR
jgi:Xaa-Pro aminopeptidase